MIIHDYYSLPGFRRQIEKAAIQLAHQYPHARRIIAKARDLCEQRAVLILNNDHWPRIAEVVSEADFTKSYNVNLAVITSEEEQPVNGLDCNCKSLQFRPVYLAGKPHCKHTLAVHIETRAQDVYRREHITEELDHVDAG